jgi:hypothetical protein
MSFVAVSAVSGSLSGTPPLIQSNVIPNAVKDLRLFLATRNPRYFRIGHHSAMMAVRDSFRYSNALSS